MKASFQFNATPDQLGMLSDIVEALQASIMCTDRQLFEINLVIEELCANVVNYGCATSMEVKFEKEWHELIITIIDDGTPFDPTTASAVDVTIPLEQRVAGGLGIHLVHHYVDGLEYRRENGCNIVTLKKEI